MTIFLCLPIFPRKPITVAASNIFDSRFVFSNYGTYVDIFAPGDGIISASYSGKHDYHMSYGTSSFVAGFAAAIASKMPVGVKAEKAEKVKDAILTSKKFGH